MPPFPSPRRLAQRDAARVECWSRAKRCRFAHNQRLQRARVSCPPCCDRRESGSFRGSSDANLEQSYRGWSAAARAAGSPPCLLRSRPKGARTLLIPFYAADARPPPPAPSQIQTNVSEAGVPRWILGAEPQAACAASRCGPPEPATSERDARDYPRSLRDGMALAHSSTRLILRISSAEISRDCIFNFVNLMPSPQIRPTGLVFVR